MKTCFRRKKNQNNINVTRNGSLLMEELVAFCDGKTNPISSFSAEEIERATKNYDAKLVLKKEGCYKLYQGLYHDRKIIVKKFEHNARGNSINEIKFASVMSAHKNVLKLLGCYLETEQRTLVFEYAENGSLDTHIFFPTRPKVQPLLWKSRVKSAVDISNVIAYLHNAFPKPVIHRHNKPWNILLDEHYSAKLSDFSVSISIPDGEYYVKDGKLIGAKRYIAPEYPRTEYFDEKIDVYSFRVVLLVLLTEQKAHDVPHTEVVGNPSLESFVRKYVEEHRLKEIIDPIILEEEQWLEKEQLQAFAAVALQCVRPVQDRPEIIEVAKLFREIFMSL